MSIGIISQEEERKVSTKEQLENELGAEVCDDISELVRAVLIVDSREESEKIFYERYDAICNRYNIKNYLHKTRIRELAISNIGEHFDINLKVISQPMNVLSRILYK